MDRRKLLLLWLPLALAISGCATPGPAPEPAPPALLPLARPQLPPAPPEVMQVREANFQKRLLDFFSPSREKPTTSPGSSAPPRQ